MKIERVNRTGSSSRLDV